MRKNMTTDEFIAKVKLVHGDKYDYSLVKYINRITKVKIICPIHGVFEQRPENHLKGFVCIKCGYNKQANKITAKLDDFINKAKLIHGDKYDYSKSEYKNCGVILKIICPVHGEFEQTPKAHLQSQGCSKCGHSKLSIFEFITRAKKIHNNKYDYSLSEYTVSSSKIKIICPTHGEFEQRAASHLKGIGCPICNESQGEKLISTILNQCKIKHIRQYKFNDCKYIRKLPFDFYLPDYNLCIEFQGEQHYTPISRFGGIKAFQLIQLRDKIKSEYCIKNDIKLLIIKFNDNITEIISAFNFSF